MGFISSIKAQFRPAPDEVLVSPPSHPQSQDHQAQQQQEAATTVSQAQKKTEEPEIGVGEQSHAQGPDADLEMNEKSQYTVGPVADQGVATVEAVQAVWGKKGRYIVIAGFVASLLPYSKSMAPVFEILIQEAD